MSYKSMIVVANTGDSSISIIEAKHFYEFRQIQLYTDSGPYDLIKCSSHKIMTSLYYADAVAFVDIFKGEILDVVTIGRRPSHIAFDSFRNLAFVSNGDSDTVSVICTYDMKLLMQIRAGSMPQGIDFNPNTEEIAVANVNSNDIWLIDGRSYLPKGVIKLDRSPISIKYSQDNKGIYIASLSSHNGDFGSVIITDSKSKKTPSTINLEGVPSKLCATKDGNYMLVASIDQGWIEVIDIKKKKKISKILTNGMIYGMALDNQEKHLYVTNPDTNSVSLIDWKLNKKLMTIKVGKEPNGIIFV